MSHTVGTVFFRRHGLEKYTHNTKADLPPNKGVRQRSKPRKGRIPTEATPVHRCRCQYRFRVGRGRATHAGRFSGTARSGRHAKPVTKPSTEDIETVAPPGGAAHGCGDLAAPRYPNMEAPRQRTSAERPCPAPLPRCVVVVARAVSTARGGW